MRLLWSLIGPIFAVLTFFNLSNILQGDESLFFRMELRNEIARVEASIAALKRRNTLMRGRIDLLKNDPQTIEEEARRRLNLVGQGEDLLIFPNGE